MKAPAAVSGGNLRTRGHRSRINRALAVGVLLVSALAVAGGAAGRTAAVSVDITGGPTGTETETTATFTFAATPSSGTTFECRIDGSSFAACTSPKTYSSLALGSHTFTVRATGRDGTRDDASRTWTIVAKPTFVRLLVIVKGSGKVTSAPAGIDCPGDCTEEFPSGQVVTLTPTAEAGAAFAGWQGACNGAGACMPSMSEPRVVLAVFRSTQAPPQPEGARSDLDKDGVSDAADDCPGTPRRLRLVARGCSAAQLAVFPDDLFDPLVDDITKAKRRLPAFPELRGIAPRLDNGLKLLKNAAFLGSQGDPCAAAQRARAGVAAFQMLLADTAALVGRLRSERAAKPHNPFGDADETDIQRVELLDRQMLVRKVLLEAQSLQRTLAALCNGIAGPLLRRGVIVELDGAHRVLKLDKGGALVLAKRKLADPVGVGLDVTVRGKRFKDGSGIVQSIDSALPIDVFTLSHCFTLQVAPLQSFPGGNIKDDSLTLHNANGYRSSSVLWLEEGMRLAVQLNPNCKSSASKKVDRWATLDLQYKQIDDGTKSETLGTGLVTNSAPVDLPPSIDPDVQATLTITELKAECTKKLVGVPPNQKLLKTCGDAEVTSTRTEKMRVRARASYASVTYNTLLFELEDVYSTTEFQPAQVTGISYTSPVTAANNPFFEGQGYLITGGASSRPQTKAIKQGESFAVYHDDPFFSPNSKVEAIGVDHAAALFWPRLKGTRGGHPFWYSAQVPGPLVRDVVDFCANTPDSFYRLPWQFGGLQNVTQGNQTTFSHSVGSWNEWAFDLIMPLGTQIYAARGGVVGFVEESLSENQDPNDASDPPADPNVLRIDHDDGVTSSWYLHMIKDGVVPQVGDRIRRGQHVAFVGNTGFSTDPHLHFQAGTMAASTPLRFEAIFPPLGVQPQTCFTPTGGLNLISTNAQP